MNVTWVRIRSWHAVSDDRYRKPYRTVCGRQWAEWSDFSDELPAAKSCETCLRIVARKADG